jgi:hypothetical protein
MIPPTGATRQQHNYTSIILLCLQEYVLPVDYEALLQLSGGSPDLEAAMELEPMEALACVGAAVHEVPGAWLGKRGCLHGWGGCSA